jgi:hypothetical protein
MEVNSDVAAGVGLVYAAADATARAANKAGGEATRVSIGRKHTATAVITEDQKAVETRLQMIGGQS